MPRILVIDDEEDVRFTIKEALERDGHTVFDAADGAEGLKVVGAEPIDLVITDILMPNKEGLETILILRENYPVMKLIAMSGGGRMKSVAFLDVAMQLGANATLKKPFSMDEFNNTVFDCLASAQW